MPTAPETPILSPPPRRVEERCRNCGAEHLGEYCHACGQHYLDGHFTLGTLWSEFVARFFRLERGLWPTIWGLSTHPGALIRGYVNGQRRRYINPFSYLFLGTAVSLIASRFARLTDISFNEFRTAGQGGVVLEDSDQLVGEAFGIVMGFWWEHMELVSLGQCVLFALLLRLFFRKGQINLAQASVFALYVFGHVALITGVLTVPLALVQSSAIHYLLYGVLSLLSLGGYFLLCVFGAYGFFGHHVWPMLKAGIAYGITYVLLMIGAAVAMFAVLTQIESRGILDTSLQTAAVQGDAELVDALLADSAGRAGLSALRTEAPLHAAIRYGHEAVVERLLDAGADTELADGDGQTPLLIAIHLEREAIVDQLLEAGADIHVQMPDGTQPIHEAADHDTDLTRRLIEAGADVNAVRDHRLATPLMLAVARDSESATCALLEAGADGSWTNADGETALDLAKTPEERSGLENMLGEDLRPYLEDPSLCAEHED